MATVTGQPVTTIVTKLFPVISQILQHPSHHLAHTSFFASPTSVIAILQHLSTTQPNDEDQRSSYGGWLALGDELAVTEYTQITAGLCRIDKATVIYQETRLESYGIVLEQASSVCHSISVLTPKTQVPLIFHKSLLRSTDMPAHTGDFLQLRLALNRFNNRDMTVVKANVIHNVSFNDPPFTQNQPWQSYLNDFAAFLLLIERYSEMSETQGQNPSPVVMVDSSPNFPIIISLRIQADPTNVPTTFAVNDEVEIRSETSGFGYTGLIQSVVLADSRVNVQVELTANSSIEFNSHTSAFKTAKNSLLLIKCNVNRSISNYEDVLGEMCDCLSHQIDCRTPIIQQLTGYTKLPSEPSSPHASQESGWDEYELPGFDKYKPTAAQAHALSEALSRTTPFLIVSGVCGSQKSISCVAIIYELLKQRLASKILVVCKTNAAADSIYDLISVTVKALTNRGDSDISPIRLLSKARLRKCSTDHQTLIEKAISFFCSDSGDVCVNLSAQCRELQRLENEMNDLPANFQNLSLCSDQSSDMMQSSNRLKVQIEEAYLEIVKPNVYVCTNFSGATDSRLRGTTFDVVIQDECFMSSFLDTFISLIKLSTEKPAKLIMCGDSRQLKPHTTTRIQNIESLKTTTAAGFLSLNNLAREICFHDNFRCQPTISNLLSMLFYDNQMRSAADFEMDPSLLQIGIWRPTHAYVMFNNNQPSAKFMKSHVNGAEAESAVKMAQIICANTDVQQHDVAIVCYYSSQVLLIQSLLDQKNLNAKALSIDGSQSTTFSVVIVCTTRNENHKRGPSRFLQSPERLNVAISRSAQACVIIGSVKFLSQTPNSTWATLISHLTENKLICSL